MFSAITVGFTKFFAKLTPSKMINIVLLGVIFYFVMHSQDLKKERDNYKDRYQTEQDKHNTYVKSIQDSRDKQTYDCTKMIQDYVDKKNEEIDDLNKDFNKRYGELLHLYEKLLEKRSKNNEKNS